MKLKFKLVPKRFRFCIAVHSQNSFQVMSPQNYSNIFKDKRSAWSIFVLQLLKYLTEHTVKKILTTETEKAE